MRPRFLTKSRFKLGMECPSKLYFTAKKDTYYDNKLDNDFLKALAEGGFQVGELAKCYYPGGTDIEELDYDKSLERTEELLKEDKVTIYEAAFLHENLFIRADLLLKDGNNIQLIEVKAKSFESEDEFLTAKGAIVTKWKPYLYDIAFQKHVLQNSHPEFHVSANLLLCDKSSVASINGLNQLFFIEQVDGRSRVRISPDLDLNKLGNRVLRQVNVDAICDMIYKDGAKPFDGLVSELATTYEKDEFTYSPLTSACRDCEFKADLITRQGGYKSGFHECWSATNLSEEELDGDGLVLNIWNSRKKNDYIAAGQYLMKDLKKEELGDFKKIKPAAGLSPLERQWLQVDKVQQKDNSFYLDKAEIAALIGQWKFPLHFIDFETTSVAIPFHEGRRPYEQVAFQFSHHVLHENGQLEHKGEWISTEPGIFPNFDFVRALKKELEGDDGTIFRYAPHENSILNAIIRQLQRSNEADKDELIEWIKTITHSTGSSADKWTGPRDMVDLWDVIKKYFYDPRTRGSNSIKDVLPAVLHASEYLQAKYSKPIYGTEIISRNFKGHSWVVNKGDEVQNPYKLLPQIHPEADNESVDEFIIDEETGIADGGAAMIAFARMQFTEMSNEERARVRNALLRYCELDTLAMVMIYEALREWSK